MSDPAGGKRTVVGPSNVIAASRTAHIRIRSSNNQVIGNRIGTNPAGSATSATSATTAGTVGFGSGAISIWVENGSGNRIGGPNALDRNIIASGGIFIGGTGAPIMLDPAGSTNINNCSGTCSVTNTTIENNYIGVAASGTGALNTNTDQTIEGIRIDVSTGNTIRSNVISGLGLGMIFQGASNNNTVSNNRIGTRASGATDSGTGIGNKRHGIWVVSGENNTFSDNTIAFNGSSSGTPTRYNGVFVEGSGADDNSFIGNLLARNGAQAAFVRGDGIRVSASQRVRISQSPTTNNFEDGIALESAANAGLAAPTINAPTAGNPTITGSTGCGSGCTVEIFTSPTAEDREGPVYLTSTTTSGGGAFSTSVAGCLGFITATVTNSTGSTSPFSTATNVSSTNACITGATVTLTAASPNARDVAIGTTTIYNHTLSHNASVERTYTIQISSDKAWATGPANITLPPNGSVQFGVTVAVPDGTAANTVDITTVRAVAGSITSATQTNTTTAEVISFNPAAPAVSPGQIRPLTTGQTTFTHTVTNTGDLAGTFAVVGPTFVGTAPAGWSIASANLAKTTLNGGESTTLTIVVNNPTPLPSADVSFNFRVRVVNGQQTDPATVDTIDVPVVRSLTFTAQPPTTQSTPPGGSLNYLYTLTNTGNAGDNFQVTTLNLTPAAPGITLSVNPSGSFNLAAGASRTITVTAAVGSGVTAQEYTFQARASAVGGSGAPSPITISPPQTIDVTGGGVPEFVGTPALNPVQAAATSQTDVAITYTVRNVGNEAVNFSFALDGSLPSGWTQQNLSDTCPDPVNPVSGGGTTCTVTLTVRVPAGQNGGNYNVRLRATALNAPDPNATVVGAAIVPVEILRGLSLSPDPTPNRQALPATTVTFSHIVTNEGNTTDSFDLSINQDQPGWTTIVTPTTLLNVPRDGTRNVTVQVTVPTGVISGTLNTIDVIARSQADNTVSATQTDTVEVEGVNDGELSPGINTTSPVSTTVTFTHTITNTGSNPLAYFLTATNSQASWPAPVITSANPTSELQPGETSSVTIDVFIPEETTGGISNTVTVELFADGDTTTLLDSATNTLLVGNPIDVLLTPDREGTALPNSTAVFTHTLSNIGVNQDTYRLTAAEAGGIPLIVAPDLVELGPGQSQTITLTVLLPIGLRAGSEIFARVTATSQTEPEVQGSATDRIIIEQVAGVDLSAAQVRGIGGNGGQIRLDSLSLRNTGNAVDTFSLSFEDVAGTPGGLTLTATPLTIPLDTGDIQRGIAVTVNVPSTVPDERIRRVRVVARSNFNPDITDSVIVDIVYLVEAPPPPPPPGGAKLYLPYLAQ
ncbi:MAG: hypothetical protein HC822_21215 [Oscillochloris sp.]|nr:hypothetical protein [Oscillochloris sp.]